MVSKFSSIYVNKEWCETLYYPAFGPWPAREMDKTTAPHHEAYSDADRCRRLQSTDVGAIVRLSSSLFRRPSLNAEDNRQITPSYVSFRIRFPARPHRCGCRFRSADLNPEVQIYKLFAKHTGCCRYFFRLSMRAGDYDRHYNPLCIILAAGFLTPAGLVPWSR